MPRLIPALALTALLTLGLVGCAAPAADETAPDASPSASAPATPDAADEPSAADAADELCETASGSEGDVCVLENATAAGDLSFSSFRIVKIIGGDFDGAIEVTGAEQLTIVEANVGGDLTVDAHGGAVVKLSTIGGTLNIAGVRSATLVKNSVSGDLLCADGVQANGDGNSVAGDVTGTCTRVA